MLIRNVAILIVLVAVSGLVACAGQSPGEPQGQQPAADQAAAVAEHMKDHFAKVSAVRDGVIMNDEKTAQEAANWIVEHQAIDGLPAGWQPYVENMRSAARRALNALGVDEAGVAVGTMARACGECHQAMKVTLTAPAGAAVPADAGTAASHMLRHKWAVDRMWVGLIYPSEDAWRGGADGLAFAALKPEQLMRDAAAGEEVGKLAAEVHELGAQGAAAEGLNERAAVYGRLLGTCIGCHRQLKPGTPSL